MAALAFVATALLLLLLLQAPDGTLSAAAAAANVKAGFRSTCTLFPDTGVTNGQDVARAPATTAQGCLEACELNSGIRQPRRLRSSVTLQTTWYFTV